MSNKNNIEVIKGSEFICITEYLSKDTLPKKVLNCAHIIDVEAVEKPNEHGKSYVLMTESTELIQTHHTLNQIYTAIAIAKGNHPYQIPASMPGVSVECNDHVYVVSQDNLIT